MCVCACCQINQKEKKVDLNELVLNRIKLHKGEELAAPKPQRRKTATYPNPGHWDLSRLDLGTWVPAGANVMIRGVCHQATTLILGGDSAACKTTAAEFIAANHLKRPFYKLNTVDDLMLIASELAPGDAVVVDETDADLTTKAALKVFLCRESSGTNFVKLRNTSNLSKQK